MIETSLCGRDLPRFVQEQFKVQASLVPKLYAKRDSESDVDNFLLHEYQEAGELLLAAV